MKFVLVDRLELLEPGKKIVMAKNVSMAEEYLGDHFPNFPVLPGVMMLEAATQTAAWLVRLQNNFAQSIIVLKEVRGVRYGTFVAPGNTLVITAEAGEIGADKSDFKVKGTVNGQNAFQAKLELAHLNLGATDASMVKIDDMVTKAMRERWDEFKWRAGVA